MRALGITMCFALVLVFVVLGLQQMSAHGELLGEGAANMAGYPQADKTLVAGLEAAAAGAIYETNEHMLAEHPEAGSIIDCLNNKGPAIKFKSVYNKNTYYLMCQIPDGRWGFGEFNYVKGKPKPDPITAFVKDDGTITRVVNYLQKWATKFTQTLPWEH